MKWKIKWLNSFSMWFLTDSEDRSVVFLKDCLTVNNFVEVFNKDYFVGYSTIIDDNFSIEQLYEYEIFHSYISDLEDTDELFEE